MLTNSVKIIKNGKWSSNLLVKLSLILHKYKNKKLTENEFIDSTFKLIYENDYFDKIQNKFHKILFKI